MKRKFCLVALLTLALAIQLSSGLLGRARAQVRISDGAAKPRRTQESNGRVRAIVELESEPVALHERTAVRVPRRSIDFEAPGARAYESRLESEQGDFMSRAGLVSPDIRERTRLRKLANAVSVEVGASELAALSALPGVKRVELVRQYHATIDASVPLINAPAIWQKLGGISVAGQGMKIAILDTGIDKNNPLFSDVGYVAPVGFPRTSLGSETLVNNKVIVAKSFLDPGTDARDENGHGSNVAGIAAGDSGTLAPLGTLSGVAPNAYLGNYRVLDGDGNGFDDQIISALEAAVADGFDVVNMSFGGDADSTLTQLDAAVEAAVNIAGKIVVISAGNSGDDGEMTVSSPGVSPSAITVAATTNSHGVGPAASVSVNGLSAIQGLIGEEGSPSSFLLSPLGPVGLVDISSVDGTSRGCSSLSKKKRDKLAGKIVLIERGNCAFSDKVNNVKGAVGTIIFNKDISEGGDGGDFLFEFSVADTTIPSVLIKRSTGLALREFLQTNPGAEVTLSPLGIKEFSSPADVLGAFSSRGPSSLDALKPDIAAPGISIYSAAITDSNGGVSDPSGFLAITGTSQAAPHITGSAALIKQLHPSWTPQQVKSALMNSASIDVFNAVDKVDRAGVLGQGAGRVNLAGASSVNATFSPASLSFGIVKRTKGLTLPGALALTNVSNFPITFTFAVQQLETNPKLDVSLSAASAPLASGQTTAITLNLFTKKKPAKGDYTGYVIVSDSLGQTLHVPYWVRYN